MRHAHVAEAGEGGARRGLALLGDQRHDPGPPTPRRLRGGAQARRLALLPAFARCRAGGGAAGAAAAQYEADRSVEIMGRW